MPLQRGPTPFDWSPAEDEPATAEIGTGPEVGLGLGAETGFGFGFGLGLGAEGGDGFGTAGGREQWPPSLDEQEA